MGRIIKFPRQRTHARTPDAVRKNASIGTARPETSQSRFAKLNDASLRRAKIFRRCAAEQSAASESCLTVIPFASAQRSIGCESDMTETISIRNRCRQAKIFPMEMLGSKWSNLKCPMGKNDEDEPPQIYLGQWLHFLDTDVTEAAKIAGCTQGYMSNIIANRKSNVNVLFLLKLSAQLGVTINDFYKPPPSEAQIKALRSLSSEAQATVLARRRAKS